MIFQASPYPLGSYPSLQGEGQRRRRQKAICRDDSAINSGPLPSLPQSSLNSPLHSSLHLSLHPSLDMIVSSLSMMLDIWSHCDCPFRRTYREGDTCRNGRKSGVSVPAALLLSRRCDIAIPQLIVLHIGIMKSFPCRFLRVFTIHSHVASLQSKHSMPQCRYLPVAALHGGSRC